MVVPFIMTWIYVSLSVPSTFFSPFFFPILHLFLSNGHTFTTTTQPCLITFSEGLVHKWSSEKRMVMEGMMS